MKNLAHTEPTLSEIARAYLTKMNQKKILEAEIDEMKATLESAALLNHGKVTSGEFNISVAKCERENFKLSDAKKVLALDLLRPFISMTAYNRLNVKFVGGEE